MFSFVLGLLCDEQWVACPPVFEHNEVFNSIIWRPLDSPHSGPSSNQSSLRCVLTSLPDQQQSRNCGSSSDLGVFGESTHIGLPFYSPQNWEGWKLRKQYSKIPLKIGEEICEHIKNVSITVSLLSVEIIPGGSNWERLFILGQVANQSGKRD